VPEDNGANDEFLIAYRDHHGDPLSTVAGVPGHIPDYRDPVFDRNRS
jgi:hypothetical protein